MDNSISQQDISDYLLKKNRSAPIAVMNANTEEAKNNLKEIQRFRQLNHSIRSRCTQVAREALPASGPGIAVGGGIGVILGTWAFLFAMADMRTQARYSGIPCPSDFNNPLFLSLGLFITTSTSAVFLGAIGGAVTSVTTSAYTLFSPKMSLTDQQLESLAHLEDLAEKRMNDYTLGLRVSM